MEFDDTQIKSSLKGIDKKAHELKEQLEKAEAKLRTSLKSGGGRGGKKEQHGMIGDEDRAVVERRKNSDDEEDEFFDRTKQNQFNKATTSGDL